MVEKLQLIVLYHPRMIFKNIFHLIKCYVMLLLLNQSLYLRNISKIVAIPLHKFNIYMQVSSYLNINSIILPSTYIIFNVRNYNLCYLFHLIFTYGLSTQINNNRKITVGLIKANSPRFLYAIRQRPSDQQHQN